jgi:hypothetical protein
MTKLFKKPTIKRSKNKFNSRKKDSEDLMDPILYNGGLDQKKYPQLPLENEDKQEEEIENPLNQR